MTSHNHDQPLLIFLHIPKTGGTTMWPILERLYGAEQVMRVNQEKRRGYSIYDAARDFLQEHAYDYSVVGGHFRSFAVHTATDRPCRFIAVLRHPVKRIISNYFFIKRKPHHWRRQRFEEIDNLEEGVELMQSNHQVRCLADLPKDVEVTEADLETAKRNVAQHFAGIGLTERFDESLILFQQALGWSTPYYFATKNAAQERPQVPDDIMQTIRERNALDLALFDWVNQRMDEQIAAQGESFQSALRTLKRANRVQGWRHQFHQFRSRLGV
jgi:hypothetical protein